MNSENLIQRIYDDMQEMKRQQNCMNDRLDGMDRRLDDMEKRFGDMDRRLDGIGEHTLENTEGLKSINLCLENEIWPSIKRVAEGHLDLSRNLKEALKADQEKESIVLRLNFLEGELGRIKAKIAALT